MKNRAVREMPLFTVVSVIKGGNSRNVWLEQALEPVSVAIKWGKPSGFAVGTKWDNIYNV